MLVKLVSWNVNGVRAVSAKPDWRWFRETEAQVVGLQETKAAPEQLPDAVREPEGWQAWWDASTVRKGYSGVAVFSRIPPHSLSMSMPVMPGMEMSSRARSGRWRTIPSKAAFPSS